jgi:hypothetical protein
MYIGILLAHPIVHISRIRVNIKKLKLQEYGNIVHAELIPFQTRTNGGHL